MARLSEVRELQIEQTAEQLLGEVFGKLTTMRLPVRLGDVLDYLGLELRQGQFEEDDVSAAYSRTEKVVYVSADDSATRKAFSIAHEIGHNRLHPNHESDVLYRKEMFNGTNSPEETEANRFAASLLMPRDLIVGLKAVTKGNEELAKIFGVSIAAVGWRLRSIEVTTDDQAS